MARRNATQDKSVETEANAPESTDQNENGTVEGAQPEATEQEGTKEKAAPVEPDLTDFKAAAEQAVEDSDPDLGTVPLAGLDAVGTQYRKLEGQKAKNRAKEHIEESIRASIGSGNYSPTEAMRRARAFVEIRNALATATASKSSAPKEPVDPTVGYANRLATLKLALSIVGNEVPDGADADKANEQADELVSSLADDVEKLRAWQTSDAEDKGDSPEVSPVVKAAFKVASGKAAGGGRTSSGGGGATYSGPRRSVAKHIQEYMADKPVGHFAKISEIAKFDSAEYGSGADHPSQGAVTAKLFTSDGAPKEKHGVEGVEPVDKDGDTPKGVRKVA